MDIDQPDIAPAPRLDYAGEVMPDDVAGPPLPWMIQWYEQAVADPRVVEPGAMVVATVDELGLPNARTVLLKALGPAGLTFFTNTRSVKGQELAGRPYASAVLLWHPMYRQIRVRGPVRPTAPEVAEAYFAERPRGSQIATRASRQSRPIGSRAELVARVAAEERRWPDTASPQDVPPPSTWGGYLIRPDVVELWVGQRSRLHDRVLFERTADGDLADAHSWRPRRLQP
jgi:pyridoxamine 5'-phosphate oxidase